MHIEIAELQVFLDEVRSRYGLVFETSRHEELRELLRNRIRATGANNVPNYITTLKSSDTEWQEVANKLTVPETYFFRIPEQFEAFSAVALPHVMESRASVRRIRLASVGCASGEEPYTMAMILSAQFPQLQEWDVDIVGFDVSQRALNRAARGLYSKWSLRATPEAMRKRFFRETRDGWELDRRIRSMVRFEAGNILQTGNAPASTFDIVFFRNVLIYFSPEATRVAVGCASHMLAAGGYLFIGSAESLRGVTNAFSLCHSHGAFYYRREPGIPEERCAPSRVQPTVPQADSVAETSSQTLPEPPDMSGGWIDEIERSSSRVSKLVSHGKNIVPQKDIAHRTALHTAMAMLASEKYAAALEALDSISNDGDTDPDVQVLRAVVLINSGQNAAAEQAATATLKRDHLNPGAHYVLALCEEQKQDFASALEHDLMAAYLDPSFAMPHVHAATVHRRRNDMSAACEEMERALSLLGAEDAVRILLFGGGFSREALQSYCEREIHRCRGGN